MSEAMSSPRLLDPEATAAVVIGAHDWSEAGLGRAPSFLRSAKGLVRYLIDSAGLGLDPALVLDLFDDLASAGEQLARIRDTLDMLLREHRDEGRPVADVLVYYVGHGHTDDQNHLSLLVRRSRRGMEVETGIKAPDLARVLRVAAPQQRRMIVLDCCFSEAAARDFIGQSGALDQAVAATAMKDLKDDQPRRGTLLLCSSPVGEVSMGAPSAARTLFTGAVLDVLTKGAEGKPSTLSFADLRDAAYEQMVVSFGANVPRPVLHQVNAAHGDLTRTPAFPNRTSLSPPAPKLVSRSARKSQPRRPPPHPSEPRRSAEENFQLAQQRQREGYDTEAARFYRFAAEQGDAVAQGVTSSVSGGQNNMVNRERSSVSGGAASGSAEPVMSSSSIRTKVFISYSHADKEWLERLKRHLKPLAREGRLDYWDDTHIQPGDDWKQEIRTALETAQVAVLLISADFFASDFIDEDELPPLLVAAQAKGTRILPMIISASRFARHPDLRRFQAVNSPDAPLAEMSPAEREKVFDRLAQTVESSFNPQ